MKMPARLPACEGEELQASVLDSVRARMHELLRTNASALRPLVEQRGLSSGGLLRARLLIAAGGPVVSSEQVDRAAILELAHLATLLHDDVLDHADHRRGEPTPRLLFGNQASILAGDFVLARALVHLSSIGSLQSVRCLSNAVAHVFEGELRQNQSRSNARLPSEEYLCIIAKKTGSLFRAACELAAENVHDALYAEMSHFGERCGVAYQLLDDYLDYFGDSASMRKPCGQDFTAGIPTLPLLQGISDSSVGAEVERLFSSDQSGQAQFQQCKAILAEHRIQERCAGIVRDAFAEAASLAER